jgi:hypothetical protein
VTALCGAIYGSALCGGFFEPNGEAVEKALKAIPQESQYAEMARVMLKWYRQYPGDWEATGVNARRSTGRPPNTRSLPMGIDCKINGAYVLLGLLYGEGDLMEPVVISCAADRIGLQSLFIGGVLLRTVGFEALPKTYYRASGP